ncbi:MAG: hypothetical protein GVY10_07080 [Verrucomicrobia bacterium]|nr:hypothetical protein [Verrucomicrobiota bacterium]
MKKNDRREEKRELAREIKVLEDELRQLGGEVGEAPDCPPEIHKAFLESVLAFEKAHTCREEWEINLAQEVGARLSLPEKPECLSDKEMSGLLRKLIEILVSFHCVPAFTDHLCDRELYRKIKNDILPYPLVLGPNVEGGHWYKECCDTDAWLRYYAGEDVRRRWKDEFDEELPSREKPVADRDAWIGALVEQYRDQPLPLLRGTAESGA